MRQYICSGKAKSTRIVLLLSTPLSRKYIKSTLIGGVQLRTNRRLLSFSSTNTPTDYQATRHSITTSKNYAVADQGCRRNGEEPFLCPRSTLRRNQPHASFRRVSSLVYLIGSMTCWFCDYSRSRTCSYGDLCHLCACRITMSNIPIQSQFFYLLFNLKLQSQKINEGEITMGKVRHDGLLCKI